MWMSLGQGKCLASFPGWNMECGGGLFIEVPGFLIAAVSLFPPGERVSHCATCILLLFRCIDSCL